MNQLAQVIRTLAPGQKRAILATTDAAVGGCAALLAMFGGVASLPTMSTSETFALVAFTTGIGFCASFATGLNQTKLNGFLQSGTLRGLAFALLLATGYWCIARVVHQTAAGEGAVRILFLAFAGITLGRALLLHLTLWILSFRHRPLRVLIYGAGKTGQQLCAALRSHDRIVPLAFLDDNAALQGRMIDGLRVYAPVGLDAAARKLGIDRVLLAMPSQPAAKLLQLSRRIHDAGLDVHALPSFAQLVGGEELCSQLAPIGTGELLGRTEHAWHMDNRIEACRGRTVMVTGAGGSVGAEICRQILSQRPRRLVLFEMSELALYTIHHGLNELALTSGIEIVPLLGSVADATLVQRTFRDFAVDIVFHAAAYKHVPLVEANPLAGLANNVLGTRVLAEAACEARIERFILVSTDKAVRPANVMGASKRLAELIVQDLAKRYGSTAFSIVRFGNVMDSSGSVMPLFRDQIAAGGPITLTHPDVTRYFMTLTEAAQLVIFAGSLDRSQGAGEGAIYVLDMGAPIRIEGLARQMVASAGLTVRDATHPDGEIEIRIIGLRAGEKLHEDLLIGQSTMKTGHPKILQVMEPSVSAFEIAGLLKGLNAAISAGDPDLAKRNVLKCLQRCTVLAPEKALPVIRSFDTPMHARG
jgi:FlaA1/EpsC-like NDP-sugar epimerase